MNAAFAVGRGVGTAFDARGLRVAFVGVLKMRPTFACLNIAVKLSYFENTASTPPLRAANSKSRLEWAVSR
jgi:hypothetical protein